ncbi:hypothetical protein BASA50_008661 [Batrachochytrium salamandrivorans]|uniref:Uncharacterized protein n=1 Tax=Batrachochytrium salamandrivorans TaxID=1357716 RepID=A0ABQ8F6C1_9FUNG|nr:hypothetical protein BASA62_003203 [Batrachochytrium salamandrivorans]KAH6575485.1 hypothetical protein BASA62_001890 [Batrachochytrium salamandrivorans]KAH6591485.1 hypothetical protein BASA50_008661 [Batrachochytrium salamandrivorans]
MRTAAILVASLLAIIGRAAPMSESADNGLQLYKRQILPTLLEEDETSQSDDETEEVEGQVFDKPERGASSFDMSQLSLAVQEMKIPGHGPHSKTGSKSTTGNTEVGDPSSPSSAAPPSAPNNGGSSPPSLQKVVDGDDSEKPSSASVISKSNSRSRVNPPEIDPTKVNLKHVVQRPKHPYTHEPPSNQFQLRKPSYYGGFESKDWTDGNTDQEMDAQEPSTSYQKKSSKFKIPSDVSSRPNTKNFRNADTKANFLD